MKPHLFYVVTLKADERSWITSVHTEHDQAQRVRGALQQQADVFFTELAEVVPPMTQVWLNARYRSSRNFNTGISRAQHWLALRGHPMEVDGMWGSKTATALCAELDKHALLDHGLRDPAVLRLLVSGHSPIYAVVAAYDDPSAGAVR